MTGVQTCALPISNFGVFVELEEDLEGLLHISELADHKVENPQDVVKPGEAVEVKILRVDIEERKIGLSLKRAMWTAEADPSGEKTGQSGGGPARGGMDDKSGILGTDKISFGAGGASLPGQQKAEEPEKPEESEEPKPADASESSED